MFTGIVQGIGQVTALLEGDQFKTITILFPTELLEDLYVSFSVSINGCCLSVTRIQDNHVSFDIINESLRMTNLKLLRVDHQVNIERSVKMNTEVGGHFLSGHIIDCAKIQNIVKTNNNCTMQIQLSQKLMKYIFYKGYVGIDGISLTIGNVYEDYFEVHLIPETMEKTIMQYRKAGDVINIEVDSQTQVIVNTVERVLKENYGSLPCLCQCRIES